ncbi:hypothetical protein Leryth_022487 [Lithospermum erythrorhizon]|nr:hypothetical protein Leryth_022487 [Lithospermum erythrorhizon]
MDLITCNILLKLFFEQGSNILMELMKHPLLMSASCLFNAMPERTFTAFQNSGSESAEGKHVYVFQREYATVDPELVDFAGTDEATTCVGIVVRNRGTGMTSVAHMDHPKIVDFGLTQMLSLILDQDSDSVLDVHLVGGFNDTSSKQTNGFSRTNGKVDGYSFSLCAKIAETLLKRNEMFHIQTLHVLDQNTRYTPEGTAQPIFHGILVEMSTGVVMPATFDKITRCPDHIVRRIRVTAAFEDPSWKGKLLETYDTRTNRFMIAPCTWTTRQFHIALSMRNLSNSEILFSCSTSPSAEAPDFVENLKRKWDYLIHHPHWEETFPSKQPRVFERTPQGNWIRSQK